ncbi:Uncharacterised protein r2_g3438 [Pycnogonum litorale]
MAPERKQISLSQKAEIVQKYRSGVKQSKLAEDYGLAKITINTIVSKGDKILAEYEGNRLKENRKCMRTAAHPELESVLFQWFQQVRAKNVPVTGPLLIEKAKEFANRLKIENFRVSTGWLDRFKDRYNIAFKTGRGMRIGVTRNGGQLEEKHPARFDSRLSSA